MVHALKITPEYYEAVRAGIKKFEVRENDRNFKTGDYLALNELDDTRTEYTGRAMLVKITYILDDEKYCKKGFVVMGFVWCLIKAENEMNQCAIYEMGGITE